MKVVLTSLALIAIVFSGCGGSYQSAQPVAVNAKPNWINNNSATVGICGTHMSGNAAQETAAMNRALAKLAQQESVNVNTNSTSTQKEVLGNYSSSQHIKTTVSATTQVKAHIEKSWRDPVTNTYYVWMVKD